MYFALFFFEGQRNQLSESAHDLHIEEIMEMILARKFPPRGMQVDLNCTLLNKTTAVEEQWEQILLKASNDLVKRSSDHFINKVEENSDTRRYYFTGTDKPPQS